MTRLFLALIGILILVGGCKTPTFPDPCDGEPIPAPCINYPGPTSN